MTTKKPSAVSGLRRGVGAVQAEPAPRVRSDESIGRQEDIGRLAPVKAKPIRVNLSLPPALYRDVQQWALDADGTLMLPRVSVQNALRAMIRACLTDEQAKAAALAQVRRGDDG